MENIMDWLLDWFASRRKVPGENREDQIQINYYEARLIDSLGVILFVNDIEEHFSIRFRNEDFQDRRFATIIGLAEMIKELLNRGEEDKA